MKTEDPLGTMRFRLMAPNLDYLPTSQAAPEYCGSPGDTFPDVKNPDRVFPKQACRAQWDGYSEPYPESEETSLSITTRVSKLTQTVTPGCTTESTRAECFWTPPEDDAVPEVFYIPQVEYFTLMLSHTMYAAKIDVYKSAKDMRGQIVDRDGNVLDPCDDYTSWGVECPPYIGDKGNDIFALATLLRAAGVDLDQESETTLEVRVRAAEPRLRTLTLPLRCRPPPLPPLLSVRASRTRTRARTHRTPAAAPAATVREARMGTRTSTCRTGSKASCCW